MHFCGFYPNFRSHLFISREYRLSFVHRDDDDNDNNNDDDDDLQTKKFFKFLHIRSMKHAWCQLLAIGTTSCGKDFYY